MRSDWRSDGALELPGLELIRLLGRGGMGEVYLARQERLNRLVAVKVLHLDGVSDAEVRVARFCREAELMAQVSHPNVLTIFDFGALNGQPFLVMEYVDGGDLRRWLEPGRALPLPSVRSLVRQIADALECLHQRGILHRDLKPENILMKDGLTPKVTDFSVAALRSGIGWLTKTTEVWGTIGYVSPEQRHRLPVDERSDEYSLAALVYEMLTGEAPLGLIRRPSAANPDVPPSVDPVLIRALEEDPAERYPTVRAFAEALQEALGATRSQRDRGRRALSSGAVVGLSVATLGAVLALGNRWSSVGDADFESPPVRSVPLRDEPAAATTVHAVEGAFGRDPATGLATRFNPVGGLMVRLPAGEFLMGAPADDDAAGADERPQHPVRISRPFWIGAHEVTVAWFRDFVRETGYVTWAEREGGRIWATEADPPRIVAHTDFHWRNPGLGYEQDESEPVVQITPEDAEAFGRWLSEQDPGWIYRLPTEAEWEYACRAGTTTRWSFGDDHARLNDYAWTAWNAEGRLHPVGQLAPNPWGLFDMHGNARELVADAYAPYPTEPRLRIDPVGPSAGSRWIFRGGSWDDAELGALQTRGSARYPKDYPYFTCGFRVVSVSESSDPVGDRRSRDEPDGNRP